MNQFFWACATSGPQIAALIKAACTDLQASEDVKPALDASPSSAFYQIFNQLKSWALSGE